jgi:hypothetical protein
LVNACDFLASSTEQITEQRHAPEHTLRMVLSRQRPRDDAFENLLDIARGPGAPTTYSCATPTEKNRAAAITTSAATTSHVMPGATTEACDGCNTCFCEKWGSASCTEIACSQG